MTIENNRLPTFSGYILEQEGGETPSDVEGGDDVEGGVDVADEPSPEETLSVTLGDLSDQRDELLDRKREADAKGDLISAKLIDNDLRILDLQGQIARIETDSANITLKGV